MNENDVKNKLAETEKRKAEIEKRKAELLSDAQNLTESISARTKKMVELLLDGKTDVKAMDANKADQERLTLITTTLDSLENVLRDVSSDLAQTQKAYIKFEAERLLNKMDAFVFDAVNHLEGLIQAISDLDPLIQQVSYLGARWDDIDSRAYAYWQIALILMKGSSRGNSLAMRIQSVKDTYPETYKAALAHRKSQ